jgi:SPP1 gp7 family putative phage head morphogenesis protein
MAWRATADVERYDEALEWFLGRTILSDEERRRIPAEARSRAFWLAGVAQMDVVQDVFNDIDRALANGTPFDEFKAQVSDKLARAWGRDDPHRVETIFRNAAQSSYNAGRWHQMTEPSVQRFRPFWQYDAILDSRVTPLCKTLDGTVLRADDPWWDTHYPPLHHRCRSSVRNLRQSEAERRGISPAPPQTEEEVPQGWGFSPRIASEFRPDTDTHDRGLLVELERKVSERPQPPPPPPRKQFDQLPSVQLPKPVSVPADYEKKLREFTRDITDDEREAIGFFSALEFTATRDAQRLPLASWQAIHGGSTQEYNELRARALKIQGAVDRMGGKRTGLKALHRGLQVDAATLDAIINASHVVSDSVVSTSWDTDTAIDFADLENNPSKPFGLVFLMRLRTERGTLGVQHISTVSSEHEVIVGAGKRFRVSRVERSEHRGRRMALVHLEELAVADLTDPSRTVRLQVDRVADDAR